MNSLDMNESVQNPYLDGRIIQFDDGSVELERSETNYIVNGDERIHTVQPDETYQSIAFQYYGDSGYWYSICDANNIIDPLSEEEFYEGLELVIPNV